MKSIHALFVTFVSILGITIGYSRNIEICNVNYAGPIELKKPFFTDSVDANNSGFQESEFLKYPINYNLLPKSKGDTVMILGGDVDQLHFIHFPLQNSRFVNLNLKVTGTKDYKIYIDDKETNENIHLKPGTRDVAIKLLTKAGKIDTINISVASKNTEYISNNNSDNRRAFTLEDVMYADHFNNVKVSPTGNYAVIRESRTTNEKKTTYRNKLIDLKSGKTISFLDLDPTWLDNKDILWFVTTETNGNRTIRTLDPIAMEEGILAENIPNGWFTVSPDNSFLIYVVNKEGPQEDKDIYRVLNPEDRQEGYRNKSGLAFYDIKTGKYRELSFGHKDVMLQDISNDGKKILIMSGRNRFEKRPTSIFSLFELSLEDMKVDTLVFEDGFITGAKYSPDGSMVAITGSPESLNGIGKNIPEDRIPSMTDGQIYLMNLSDKNVLPITKNFNPSVENIQWHKFSGNLFFTTEDKDKISLYQYNPQLNRISLINIPEDIINVFSLSNNTNSGALIAESVSNPDVLYSFNITKGKQVFNKIDSKGKKMLSEVTLAEVVDWDFVNSKGDTINGRYYLPPNFDPDKKYPMIVNYYGGCSPTSKNFATRYPHHLYANNGYVVYVINPSGATGFGQEFSSRHVNTAGRGVAEDIIEGTEKFVEQHPFVNKDKIGCIGASYGGFMTQYLQTVTDLFAAAISHAGISDHTSYWGNGYWGYSYSEISMAESYPWSQPDLYVKQSPLYNADKINTPILFLHGDIDTNVPPAESIQLFTALKLLGKDTALVEVKDQNHHILDSEKRMKWQDTIFAWFAKYLQDDPTWWNYLYPPTSLE